MIDAAIAVCFFSPFVFSSFCFLRVLLSEYILPHASLATSTVYSHVGGQPWFRDQESFADLGNRLVWGDKGAWWGPAFES